MQIEFTYTVLKNFDQATLHIFAGSENFFLRINKLIAKVILFRQEFQ